MPSYFINAARLSPYTKRPRTATGYVTVYSFEPGPDDETVALGNLYGVIEVISGGREAEEAVNLTFDTFEQAYYAAQEGVDVATRFEGAIKAINRSLTEYVNHGNAGWVGKMSAVLGVLCEDELHIAYTGSAEAYLYRKGKGAQITTHTHAVQQPSKIFASIASGELEVGDKLLLATPALVHQLSLEQLTNLVVEHQPTTAANKLVELLADQPTDRVAALILEFTTPELAAQAMPTHTVVTPPADSLASSIVEQAKAVAAPIVDTANEQSKRLTKHAQKVAPRVLPALRNGTYKVIEWLRQTIQEPRKHRNRLIGLGAGLVIIIGLLLATHHSSGQTKLTQQFESLTTEANLDHQATSASADAPIRANLVSVQGKLEKLATKANTVTLDKWLGKQTNTSLPASVAVLETQVQNDIDTIDHVQRVSGAQVADFSKVDKGATLNQIAIVAGQAVAITPTGHIYVASLTTNTVHASSANNQLGTVVAIAPASSGTGVYILTGQPAVWLYDVAADSLTRLDTGSSATWPSASGLASYNGNLYLLTSDGVNKYAAASDGFTTASPSLSTAEQGVKDSTTIAIDGNIYLGGPTGISRYLAGSLATQTALPSGFTAITTLIPGNGNYILAFDKTSGRLADISSTTSALSTTKEYLLTTGKMDGVTTDPSTAAVYALSGQQLLKLATSSL